MKQINFFLSIIPLLLLLIACSTNKPVTDKNLTHEKTKDPKHTLCIYKKEKGIAEIIAIKQRTYQFKFYLGDDIFEKNRDDIVSNNELKIGNEFKAVKEVMVNKTKRHDCLPVEFHLIP